MNDYVREQKAGPCSVLPASWSAAVGSIPLIGAWAAPDGAHLGSTADSLCHQKECQAEVIWLLELLDWSGWHLRIAYDASRAFCP